MRFEQITSVHYQAISHTDKENLKFTVFFLLDLIIYVKQVKNWSMVSIDWSTDLYGLLDQFFTYFT